jgi:hypothetical protein
MSTIPDDDKDTVLFPLNKYWFTFGSGHHMGPEKKRLSNCYTIVEATSHEMARSMMVDKRGGLRWASPYTTADGAGVDEFGLVHIPFEEVQRQEGHNL